MKKLVLLFWVAALGVGRAETTPVEKEIEHLITFVQNSNVVFIRNGDEHTARDAAEHILKKYNHYREKIDSTELFIELTATRSLVSKKDYQVRHPDGTLQASGAWLLEELERHRKR